jgi:hypothetical protein
VEGIEHASAMAMDEENRLFVSSAELGVLYRLDFSVNELRYFAGVARDKHFIDGKDCRFYAPSQLYAQAGSLYVADCVGGQYILRRVRYQGEAVLDVETLAGNPLSTNAALTGPAKDLQLCPAASGRLFDNLFVGLAVSNGVVYFSDNRTNVIRKIIFEEPAIYIPV